MTNCRGSDRDCPTGLSSLKKKGYVGVIFRVHWEVLLESYRSLIPTEASSSFISTVSEPFDDFIRVLYESAVTSEGHQNWLRAIRKMLNADMSAFVVANPGGRCVSIVGDGFTDSLDTAYFQRYQYIDPLQKHLVSSPNHRVASNDPLSMYDLDKRGEFYNDYLLKTQIRHCMHFCLEIGKLRIRVTAMRRSNNRFSLDQKHLMSRASRHVESALRMRETVNRKLSLAHSALAAFENVSFGFAVVSSTGLVHHTNAPMQRILESSPDLGIRNGKLIGRNLSENSALEGVIRQAAERRSAGGLQLGSGPNTQKVTVVVSPLPEDAYSDLSPTRMVAIFVSAPNQRASLSDVPIRGAFGLTSAEARVATLLAGGLPTSAIAKQLNVRTSTIRAHLKAVFAKTGTHSQAELLNLLFQTNAYNMTLLQSPAGMDPTP